MRSLILLFCVLTALLRIPPVAADLPEEKPHQPPTEQHEVIPSHQDFNEPTFPVEDLIGHPTPESDKFLVEFVKMAATLGLVIAMILFIAWFLKRMVAAKIERGNADSSITIVDRRALSQKTMLYLIEVAGKGIVVAESPHGVTFLGNYPAFGLDAEETNKSELPPSFKQILNQ